MFFPAELYKISYFHHVNYISNNGKFRLN